MPICDGALEVLKRELPQEPMISEVGAHQGDAVLQLFDIRPDANIFAFEADCANYQKLCKNVGKKAYCFNAAITSKKNISGNLPFYTSKKENRCSTLYEEAMKAKDKKRYVENVVKAISVERCVHNVDFVRFDCYGAEYEIFSGDTEWVKDIPLIMLSLHVKPAPFDGYEKKRKKIKALLATTHECIWKHGGNGKHLRTIWRKK